MFHQGLIVSAFSMGRIISAPLIGHLSQIYGYRPALILSNSIVLIGFIVFILAKSFTRLYLLFTAQFIIGFGAGSNGAARSYITEGNS